MQVVQSSVLKYENIITNKAALPTEIMQNL